MACSSLPSSLDNLSKGDDRRGEGLFKTLPDVLLAEIVAQLGVRSLGRASSVSRRLRDTCANERLWISLWEGPLPDGHHEGGKAAHEALWLLVRGRAEQASLAVCQPSLTGRRADGYARLRRRRTRDRAAAGGNLDGRDDVNLGSRSSGGGGGGGGGGVRSMGFPVHVTSMAISGTTIATAAGSEIAVWDMEEAVPRARFSVNGHGSVTFLLLLDGILFTGDNSGYLRRYDVSTPSRIRLLEIRTHTDRITAMDAFDLSPSTTRVPDAGEARTVGSNANINADVRVASPNRGGSVGSWRNTCFRWYSGQEIETAQNGAEVAVPVVGDAAVIRPVTPVDGQQLRWDQGHGWGNGWVVEGAGEFFPVAVAAAPATRVPSSVLPWDGVTGQHDRQESCGRRREWSATGALPHWRPIIKEHDGEEETGEEEAISGGALTARSKQQPRFSYQTGALSSAGRGRGCGRGSVRRSDTIALGGGGFRTGHSDCARLGGRLLPRNALSLGKRSAYAGRGQGEELEGASGGEDVEAYEKYGRDELRRRNQDISVLEEIVLQEEKETDEAIIKSEAAERMVLFTGSDDGTAKAWDAVTGRFLWVYARHSRGVTCLQATRSDSYGPILVTGGGDSRVIIWEVTTGHPLARLETGGGMGHHGDGHGPRIGCLKVFNNTIVVGEDRHLAVWKLARGKAPRLEHRRFCEHQRPVRKLDVIGRYIVTCSGDFFVRFWDSTTGACIRELEIKSGSAITSFRLSGLLLLTASLFDSSVLMTHFLPPWEDGERKSPRGAHHEERKLRHY